MNATNDPASSAEVLVSTALQLKEQIAVRAAELKLIEARIVELGAGKHASTDGRTVTVVGAVPGKPGAAVEYAWPDSEDAEETIKEICGEEFRKVFDREVIYRPCEGFAAVVPKLLTPARAGRLLEICARVGKGTSGKSGYLIYPK